MYPALPSAYLSQDWQQLRLRSTSPETNLECVNRFWYKGYKKDKSERIYPFFVFVGKKGWGGKVNWENSAGKWNKRKFWKGGVFGEAGWAFIFFCRGERRWWFCEGSAALRKDKGIFWFWILEKRYFWAVHVVWFWRKENMGRSRKWGGVGWVGVKKWTIVNKVDTIYKEKCRVQLLSAVPSTILLFHLVSSFRENYAVS